MKELHLLAHGEVFRFVAKDIKYCMYNLDGACRLRTCNNKFFKYLGHAQFIEVKLSASEGRFHYIEVPDTLFNIFIHGRGENKQLYYEMVKIQ